jgi:hypothetical protein
MSVARTVAARSVDYAAEARAKAIRTRITASPRSARTQRLTLRAQAFAGCLDAASVPLTRSRNPAMPEASAQCAQL